MRIFFDMPFPDDGYVQQRLTLYATLDREMRQGWALRQQHTPQYLDLRERQKSLAEEVCDMLIGAGGNWRHGDLPEDAS